MLCRLLVVALASANCTTYVSSSSGSWISANHTDDTVVVTIPPGLGANHSLAVEVWDSSGLLSSTSPLRLGYGPPVITQATPAVIYVTDGTSSASVAFSGVNMGRLQDAQYWTSRQAADISVTVGGLPCASPSRVILSGALNAVQVGYQAGHIRSGARSASWPPSREHALLIPAQCVLGRLPVGSQNVSISIAGSVGTLSASSSQALLVVCSNGYFGNTGEECLPCPVGAQCLGYVASVTASANGDAMAGISHYPNPLPGFYNLNGSMASLCPALAVVPGRDVCIVACSPPGACAGGNLCSAGYASKVPAYRCGSCASGFYPNGNGCVACPSSPATLFIAAALIIIGEGPGGREPPNSFVSPHLSTFSRPGHALCSGVAIAGYFLNSKGVNLAFLSIGVDFFQVLAMFAAAQVSWPPALLQLWNLLSAFNFNINIVACVEAVLG